MPVDNDKVILLLPDCIKILDQWEFTSAEKAVLLGFDNQTAFQVMLANPSAHTFTPGQIERMSYIFRICISLMTILPELSQVRHWLHSPNNDQTFNGKSPIELIKKGKALDLALISNYLQMFYETI